MKNIGLVYIIDVSISYSNKCITLIWVVKLYFLLNYFLPFYHCCIFAKIAVFSKIAVFRKYFCKYFRDIFVNIWILRKRKFRIFNCNFRESTKINVCKTFAKIFATSNSFQLSSNTHATFPYGCLMTLGRFIYSSMCGPEEQLEVPN